MTTAPRPHDPGADPAVAAERELGAAPDERDDIDLELTVEPDDIDDIDSTDEVDDADDTGDPSDLDDGFESGYADDGADDLSGDPEDVSDGEWDLEARYALKRVGALRTELEDITEVEYRQLRLERRSEERRVGKECRSRWSPYH